MNISWYASCFRCSCGVFALATAGLLAPAATAQLTPDNTLGSEQSIVNENVQVRGDFADQIDGGAIRGSNLFHSFSEFNVNEQQRVYFANPAGIETILNRVTGNDVSDIMGTLGVDGGANLFLLNPNGIIFGENAQLDISGSFTASTADAIVFPDGGAFSAINPGDTSLLTVGVPLGVQYGPGAQGDITNAGNLAVGAGQEMTLYGDTVRSSGSLTTSGGLVQALGNRVALTDSARIDVASETGGGTVLVGGEYRGEGPVPNALRTYVGPDVVINADAVNNGDGGRVIVWADEATGFYGNISARGGSLAGDGGFVEVSGKQSLAFDGLVDVGAVAGQAGQLLLDPENVIIVEQAPGVNDGELNDNEILFGDEPGSEFIISGNAIRDALNNADVTIEAEDTIRSDETVVISSGASNSLTLNASEIILTAPIINLGGGDMGGGAINLESTNGS
ncbi:MAG: filamentous hemagglutinin N-terminal domain-containing protein, partial [Cyanobacteria bacterium P01_H01_bin.21]